MSENKLIIFAIGFLILFKVTLHHREFIHYFFNTYQKQIILSTLLNLIIYRYLIKIILLKSLYHDSIIKVDKHIASLYYILLVGSIGSRKSANLTAFTQMCEMSKISKMHENHYKLKVLLSDYLDFQHFDTHIHNNLDLSKVYCDEDYHYFVYKYFKSHHDFKTLSTTIQFESFRNTKLLYLLSEYVELYYYINFRKNNILSNTTIESINTGLNSMPVQESFFQLYRKNDLAHEKYLVIVEDEKGVVDNARVYARLDKESVKSNDDGKDIHAMLQRHGSKGTNTTLVVSQSEKDVTANRRRLPNRFVEFLKPHDVYIFNIELAILKFLKQRQRNREVKYYNNKMRKAKTNTILYRVRKKEKYLIKANKIYCDYRDFLDQDNKFKRKIKKLENLEIRIGRHLYLVQYMFLHESEERIGKKGESETVITSSFPLTLVYPANITYDRYDQYAFYDIYNERNKIANKPLNLIHPFKSKIMNRKEHEKMNYRAINRIFDELDQQKENTKSKKESKSNVSYDAY